MGTSGTAAAMFSSKFLSIGELLQFAADPWSFWYPQKIITRNRVAAVVTDIFAYPDADDSDGSWLNELGTNTNLYASIDEVAVDDADYIISSTTTGDKVRLRLSDPSATMTQPFRINYRCKTSSGTANLIGRIYQGTGPGTLITQWTETGVTSSFATHISTMPSTDFATISDFNDLYIEFELG